MLSEGLKLISVIGDLCPSKLSNSEYVLASLTITFPLESPITIQLPFLFQVTAVIALFSLFSICFINDLLSESIIWILPSCKPTITFFESGEISIELILDSLSIKTSLSSVLRSHLNIFLSFPDEIKYLLSGAMAIQLIIGATDSAFSACPGKTWSVSTEFERFSKLILPSSVP